jgi:HSP20 family protein
VLTISGERKMEQKKENENYRRIERVYGSVSRSMRLPKHVLADKISAKHENGVLTIHLPKQNVEALKPQDIKIS